MCDHGCIKIDGEDTCTCNSGYKLNITDNSTCIDENECKEGSDNCDDDNGVCTNTAPGYTCSCEDGYKLETDNKCSGKLYWEDYSLENNFPNKPLTLALYKHIFQYS